MDFPFVTSQPRVRDKYIFFSIWKKLAWKGIFFHENRGLSKKKISDKNMENWGKNYLDLPWRIVQ